MAFVTRACFIFQADEEALTRPATLICLEIDQSAAANARHYYAQRKAAALKAAKTEQAAQLALRAAEVKAKASVAKIKVSATIKAIRGTFWWEKFAWFISSQNFLVLAANDGPQTELLVHR